MADAGGDLDAKRGQVFGDDPGGAELAIRQFGILVKVAAPFDDLAGQLIAQARNGFQG